MTATPVVQPGMVMAQPGYPSPAPMVVAQPGMASPMMASPMMLNWMPLPPSIPGVPPGLEYLSILDMIVVNQVLYCMLFLKWSFLQCMEIIEILTDWETANRYSLRNRFGQQIYFAAEESDCCSRQNCGSSRGFTIHVVDNFRRVGFLLKMKKNRERPVTPCRLSDCGAQNYTGFLYVSTRISILYS